MERRVGGGFAATPLMEPLGSPKCPKGHLKCQKNVKWLILGGMPENVNKMSEKCPGVGWADRTFPTCKKPVGLGANLKRIIIFLVKYKTYFLH